MTDQILTRMGDGERVSMSAAEIKEDISEGIRDAAQSAEIPELTAGKSEQLFNIMAEPSRTVSVSAGEEVVVTDPMYFPFFTAAATAGARKVLWSLREEEGYGFDVEELKNAITTKTRLIFLCSPHNPTGRVMTQQELSSIADLAVDHDLIVASDELWEDIVYDNHKHISIAALGPEISDRTLTVFGFSKAFNISGLQAGYASTTNKKMMKEM